MHSLKNNNDNLIQWQLHLKKLVCHHNGSAHIYPLLVTTLSILVIITLNIALLNCKQAMFIYVELFKHRTQEVL